MKEIDCSAHLAFFADVEKKESLPEGTFQVVESVANWCALHGVSENNPGRIAKALTEKETSKPLILLTRRISPAQIQSVLDYMECTGCADLAERIKDEASFLRILVYHEVAHIKLTKPSEEECDRWAFRRANP